MTAVFYTMGAGAVAGGFGAMLGIGGGVFLVPFLNLVLGLPAHSAFAVSLVTVIATSSMTLASPGRLHMVNLRLGMVLEIFTTVGGLAGILFVNHVSDRLLLIVFASTLAAIALVTLSRMNRRNVLPEDTKDIGVLGGRFHERESQGEVAYRVKRVPVAFSAAFVAGFVSNLGIGGGVLKVPALNVWCGVPIRAAAATSALMIGATAVVGSINYFARGEIIPHLAAAAALGVLAGSQVGHMVESRSRAKWLKVCLAGVLITVSAIYFFKAGR